MINLTENTLNLRYNDALYLSNEEKFMATLNDYKLVKNISKKYFDRLEVELDIDENQKSRLGFYLFILSCITEITDIDTLK